VPVSSAPFQLAAMLPTDLQAVQAIEKRTTAPWSIRQLALELTAPMGWQFTLRETGSSVIIAFITGTLVCGEAEIRKLAVAPEKRRTGAASFLLNHLFSYLEREKAEQCFLELRAGNLAATGLYQRFNFQKIGLRKSYYSEPCEDAVVMRRLMAQLPPTITNVKL